MPLRMALLVLTVFLPGCHLAPKPVSSHEKAAVNQLLVLIDQRLAVAPLVAAAKWHSGDPIDAPQREARILAHVLPMAKQAGVSEELARAFFQSQFDASKLIQRQLHDQWQADPATAPSHSPDLGSEVRPALDRLTPQLIHALARWQLLIDHGPIADELCQQISTFTQQPPYRQARAIAVGPLLSSATPLLRCSRDCPR